MQTLTLVGEVVQLESHASECTIATIRAEVTRQSGAEYPEYFYFPVEVEPGVECFTLRERLSISITLEGAGSAAPGIAAEGG